MTTDKRFTCLRTRPGQHQSHFDGFPLTLEQAFHRAQALANIDDGRVIILEKTSDDPRVDPRVFDTIEPQWLLAAPERHGCVPRYVRLLLGALCLLLLYLAWQG
jgi:hypothetical protein